MAQISGQMAGRSVESGECYGYWHIFCFAFHAFRAIIVSIMIRTSRETVEAIAAGARRTRLVQNLTQAGLEQRSGVSLGTIKLFERTGKISLESLVKIAIALDVSDGFASLFADTKDTSSSIDELLRAEAARKSRKRGRLS